MFFIHQNIPAQFRHLAPALASDGDRVFFITANADAAPPAGVTKVPYKLDLTIESPEQKAFHYATQVARAIVYLKTQGIVPDLIIGHASWGELMFVRDIFPRVPLLSYFEWFHRDSFGDFDPDYERTPNGAFVLRAKNVPIYVTGDICTAGLTPTSFQLSSFPVDIQRKTSVIHDGIDTTILRRPEQAALGLSDGRFLTSKDEVVTYVARGLEPARGVRPVLRAVAELCRRRPKAHVVVIGEEKTVYGNPPADGASHKSRLLAESEFDLSRVHFLGRVSYQTFLGALFISRAHVYFTYPYFLSWSMLEAMAAECLVIGSRTPPVEEVIRDGENGLLVPFHDHTALADLLTNVLERPDQFEPLRRAARRTILERYDLHGICLPRQKALISSLI